MKACPACGSKYTDYVSFCFSDGTILETEQAAGAGLSHASAPPKSGGARRTRGRSLLGRSPGFEGPSGFESPSADSLEPELTLEPLEALGPPLVQGADFLIKVLEPMTVLPREKKAKDAAPAEKPAPEAPAPPVEPAAEAAPPAAAPQPAPAPAPVAQSSSAQAPQHAVVAPPPPEAPAPAADDLAGWSDSSASTYDDEPVAAPSRPLWIVPLLGGVAVLGLGALVLVALGVVGVTSTGGDQPVATAPPAPTPPAPATAAPPVEPVAAGTEPAAAAVDSVPEQPADLGVADSPAEPVVADLPPEPATPAPSVAAVVSPPGPASAPANTTKPPDPWTPPPAAKVGTLLVTTTPAGARVKVGDKAGTAPFSVELPLGSHEITAELKGHTSASKRVELSGARLEVPLTLKPEPAAAAATNAGASSPPPVAARSGNVMVFCAGRDGDELFIDGKSVGRLPGRFPVTEGKHTFKVVGAKGDFENQKDVAFNAAGTAVVTLAP
jgi:hypothetical protein